ncbi:hypothetical protein D917_06258 [Trichinella nativa]|uniref:Uncharacterized protein n=1 Tax=Trichinella nativa TaxID=6335 RepID=A0A1Y3EU42_9BILA|nr:hypothetical protein D917_06258 [Trichinella nativa]
MIAREITASIGCWANGNMSKNMQPIRRTTGKIKLTTNGLRDRRNGYPVGKLHIVDQCVDVVAECQIEQAQQAGQNDRRHRCPSVQVGHGQQFGHVQDTVQRIETGQSDEYGQHPSHATVIAIGENGRCGRASENFINRQAGV